MLNRILGGILLVAFLVVQVFAGAAFADSSDARKSLEELEKLSDDKKGLLLQNVWDYVVARLGDGKPLTVEEDLDDLYAEIKGNLDDLEIDIIDETGGTPGDGKISKASVELMIEKLINNKGIIVTYYNFYKDKFDKTWIKETLLELDSTATEGEVFVALLPFTVEILTLNDDNDFIRYGDTSAKMKVQLGLLASLFSEFLENINSQVDEVAVKINNNMDKYGISLNDAIYALSIYDLYHAPSQTTPDPGTPAEPAPTPSPGPDREVSDGASDIEDAAGENEVTKEVVKNVEEAIEKIADGLSGDDDKSTSENVAAVVDVIKNVLAISSKAQDGESKSDLVKQASDLLGKVAEASKDITDSESSQTVVESIADMIGNIAGGVDDEDEDTSKTVTARIKNSVKTAAKLVANVSEEKAVEVGTKVIESAAKAAEKANKGGEKRGLEKAAAHVASKVVEAVGTSSLKAVVSEADAASILEKAEKAVSTAEDMEKTLKDNKISGKVERKVKLIVEASAEEKSLVELPAALLDSVGEKGIEKVEISSGVASLTVEPGFMDVEEGANIRLETKKVVLDEELEKSLSPDQKKLLDEGAQLFDFDAAVVSGSTETKVSRFKKKITVAVPYTLKPADNPEKITVLYLADDGTVKNMTGKYDPIAGTVSFKTNHFSKYIVKSVSATFADVPGSYWAYRDIGVMAAKGIVEAKPAEGMLYKPLDMLTRIEFCKYVSIALNIVDEEAECTFPDVSKDDGDYIYVASAVKAGIIKGYPDGTFKPMNEISRQEMAVMIERAIGETIENADEFLDYADKADIADYALSGVAIAARAGIITGKPGKIMDPEGTTTRAEAAAILHRLYNY